METNEDEEGQAKNRRIEIMLVPSAPTRLITLAVTYTTVPSTTVNWPSRGRAFQCRVAAPFGANGASSPGRVARGQQHGFQAV
jgi:hypothetical protein